MIMMIHHQKKPGSGLSNFGIDNPLSFFCNLAGKNLFRCGMMKKRMNIGANISPKY